MFKDSFNCLNDVHKRCILNSIEFCTHLEILKKNFQGCLSVQLSKFIVLKSSIHLCLRSFCVAVVSRRLDYNSTTHHICQQLYIFLNFILNCCKNNLKLTHSSYQCSDCKQSSPSKTFNKDNVNCINASG